MSFPNLNDLVYIMLLVLIQLAEQISMFIGRNFAPFTWTSRYHFDHALLGNSKNKSIESINCLLSCFFAFDISLPITSECINTSHHKGSNLRDISIGSCYEALGSLWSNWTFYGKIKTFWWKNLMHADDNTLKALGDLSKNCLFKSYVCYLLLNLSIICIYCKVPKSVTVNCWKNIAIYVKAVRVLDRNSFALHCNDREG